MAFLRIAIRFSLLLEHDVFPKTGTHFSASCSSLTKEDAVAKTGEGTSVAIIGAGIGGLYVAAELGMAGCKLRLHDINDKTLVDVRSRGGVDVENPSGVELAPVELASTDIRASVDGADIIIVTTGGNFQATVARSLAPLLRDGQLILLIQGNTGGSLIVRRALSEAGCTADVDVAEMDNYPLSCWRLGPTRIRPIVRKRWLQISAFPGRRGAAVFRRLSPLFPTAIAAANVLYTGFTNANAMLHVANCVANAANIERAQAYKFYAEGVTPAVARLYEAINAERVAVAAALGASVPNLADWFDRVYGVREASLVEACQRLTYNSDGPYQATGTPKSLGHKYIVEDVPTGLIPMSALGAAVGVKTPVIDTLVDITRCMTGKSFAAEGRTLERLGLAGMDAAQIRRVVEEGFG
jgi:opine dehydrogenase